MIALSLHGQSKSLYQKIDTLKNQIFIEIFGNGIKYSVNYERRLTNWTQLNIASRFGLGYYPFNYQTFSVPVEVTTFWGSDREFIETGVGFSFCSQEKAILIRMDSNESSKNTREQMLVTFRFGYRYQKPNGRSSLKLALTILFETSEGDFKLLDSQVPIGFSYGYRF